MKDQVMALLAFLGDWLLFIFPMYQGVLEITEQKKALRRFMKKGKKYPDISLWYWLLPPYKIFLERQRIKRILRDSIDSEKNFFVMQPFMNKATAWFFVAIAGLLNGIAATNDLLEQFKVELPWQLFILLILVLIVSGILQVIYRSSKRRQSQQLQKYQKGAK
ncbi:hypothetical protein [Enterococcus sp. AZ103]|uniref:hypothetical protein n=1 Tax=Enterococcus sp. AZ103 TaxID=2774628 RepID=UPI003F1F173B